jgi:TolB-like protein/DNA-binding winged helix-turn-helix (wHTH) protein/lipoprotein NlpI
MDHSSRTTRIARFGPFELDSRSGELRRSGSRVRLQEQPVRLLMLLLERAGEVVTRDELRDRLWGSDTFVDFDQGLNAAIRKLRTAVDDSAEAPRFIETLARHGYRFIAPVEWVGGDQPRRRVRWIVATAALLSLAAVAGLLWRQLRSLPRSASPAPVAIHSIAVLPFATGDKESEYLGEGLAEGLIDELSTWPEMHVISRSSSFRFKGKSDDPRSIGRQLNVGAVLSGNLQRTPVEYQLHAELTDSRDGSELWSRQYRTRIANLLDLQRHVAADIALRLGFTRADAPRLGRKTSPAYDLYLRGRYLEKQADFLRASSYFEEAVRVDPSFALGYAGLGSAYGRVAGNSLIPGSEREFRRKSHEALNRALALDPTIAEAYASRAATESTFDWDFPAAERDFRRAIELKPTHAEAHEWYSIHLYRTGRFAESRHEINLAYQLEPYSVANRSYICWNRLVNRQYAEAIAFCRQSADVDAKLVNRSCLTWCQLLAGDYEGAIATIRIIGPANADELAEALRGGGREALWKKRIEQYERTNSNYYVAACYSALGDRDHAFAFLDRAFEQRSPLIAEFYVDPRLDSLRSDPRFEELARRIGLPQVRARAK